LNNDESRIGVEVVVIKLIKDLQHRSPDASGEMADEAKRG